MERDQATELIHNLLRGMLSKNASDLFVTTGFPPAFKVDGRMTPVSSQALTSAAHSGTGAQHHERPPGGRV